MRYCADVSRYDSACEESINAEDSFLAKRLIFMYLYVPFRWVETVFFLTWSVHRSEHV